MTTHLLLIEDDQVSIYITHRLLEAAGITASVNTVRNGMEALEYLACEGAFADRSTGNPALILLDLKLPDIEGFELFKQIRSNPGFSSIPVFVLSASDSDENRIRSELLGISNYLTKPLDIAALRRDAAEMFSTSVRSEV